VTDTPPVDDDFGDFTDDDAVDSAPPDAEALARRFYAERHRLAPDPTRAASLDDLHPFERALVVYVFAVLIVRLAREWRPT